MKEHTNLKKVELGETGQIELPTIDVTKYVGNKAKIATVDECEGNYGYFVKVETVILETIEGGENPIEIKASRIFGLQKDSEGKIGWGKVTNLGTFLEKMGVAHYKELVGKEVIVQTVINKKDKKDYLCFN